ncbi:hypothetical protein PtB15_1B688 [Puccinia triticina]|nr:hypothetical protein PtB15_1B688 [Puccinia triticina]
MISTTKSSNTTTTPSPPAQQLHLPFPPLDLPSALPMSKRHATPQIIQPPIGCVHIKICAHHAAPLLLQSALVILEQREILNLFVGVEQANQYYIFSWTGETVGPSPKKNNGPAGPCSGNLRAPIGPSGQAPASSAPSVSSTRSSLLWIVTRKNSEESAGQDEDPQEHKQFARVNTGFLSQYCFTLDADGRPTGTVHPVTPQLLPALIDMAKVTSDLKGGRQQGNHHCAKLVISPPIPMEATCPLA